MLENNKIIFLIHFHGSCHKSWILAILQPHMWKKTITKETQTKIHSEIDAITTIFSIHKTNIEEYINIMLHKQFSITKIYQVKIDTKFATNIKHLMNHG
jgi:hypothetical protein